MFPQQWPFPWVIFKRQIQPFTLKLMSSVRGLWNNLFDFKEKTFQSLFQFLCLINKWTRCLCNNWKDSKQVCSDYLNTSSGTVFCTLRGSFHEWHRTHRFCCDVSTNPELRTWSSFHVGNAGTGMLHYHSLLRSNRNKRRTKSDSWQFFTQKFPFDFSGSPSCTTMAGHVLKFTWGLQAVLQVTLNSDVVLKQ